MGECRSITKEKKSERMIARRASPNKRRDEGIENVSHSENKSECDQCRSHLKTMAKHRVHNGKRMKTSVKCCAKTKRQQWWNQLQPNDVQNEKEEADADKMQTKQEIESHEFELQECKKKGKKGKKQRQVCQVKLKRKQKNQMPQK